jgi:E3 ubiquitin-protein ligase HUWE1
VLIPALGRLSELCGADDADPDDLTLKQFCHAGLAEHIVSLKPTPALLTLIDELSVKGPAFFAFLEAVCSRLRHRPRRKELRSLLALLAVLARRDAFAVNFTDICLPSLLRAVCGWENRGSTFSLLGAARVLLQAGPMPVRVFQVAVFMFLTGSRGLVKHAVDLCLKLQGEYRDDIAPYVQFAFDRLVAGVRDGKGAPELALFLTAFPLIANARRPEMLDLLSQLLRNAPETSLPLIGALFGLLAPGRVQSCTARLSDSLSFDASKPSPAGLPIPATVRQQAPDFWDIFATFRPLINEMVQRNPRLITTTFQFLQDYPDLLDFGLRVSVFQEGMRRALTTRTLQIAVRRSEILQDSYLRLRSASTADLLGHIRVRFIGEDGVDAGGLTKNWFATLVKALFNPNYALFAPSANGRSYQPSPTSHTVADHLSWFRFSGKILARALIDGVPVEAHLTTSFCKQLMQLPVSLRDLEAVNREVHDSLVWIRRNDVTDLDMTFAADVQSGLGLCTTEDLKPGGRSIKVTNENKEEYVALMADLRLKRQIREQVNAFCEGFYELIPVEQLRRFSPSELDLLICGVPEIDIDDFEANCEFNPPFTRDHRVVRQFFGTLRTWDNERLAKLILFITGSSQIPMNGFRMLRDMGQPIVISPGGDAGRLPAAHTCANTLDLPMYENAQDLNTKLSFAIEECNTFEFK